MAYTERFVTDAGAGAADGTSLANAWSWATMLTTATAGDSINYNGAITRTTSADTFTNPGTAIAPMRFRSCDGSGVAITSTRTRGQGLTQTGVGVITYTTGRLTFPAFCVVEDASFTSAATAATVTGGAQNLFRRCSCANTHASSASAVGLSLGGAGSLADDCDITESSSSGSAYAATTASSCMMTRCRVSAGSGANGVQLSDRSHMAFMSILNTATAVATAGTSHTINNCSFRNFTVQAINHAVSAVCQIQNCVAWGNGSAKWYNSTTSVRPHFQMNNAIGNVGADTNEGDWPINGEITLTADPFTSSTDLTLNSTAGGGAACKGVGTHTYLDIGAWQVEAAAATGTSLLTSCPLVR